MMPGMANVIVGVAMVQDPKAKKGKTSNGKEDHGKILVPAASKENGKARGWQDCSQHPLVEGCIDKETAPDDGEGDKEHGEQQAMNPAHAGQ